MSGVRWIPLTKVKNTENISNITMTSWWARWRLKSPASRLFTYLFISKKKSKLRVTVLCEGNSTVTGEFHSQSANNAKNDLILKSLYVSFQMRGLWQIALVLLTASRMNAQGTVVSMSSYGNGRRSFTVTTWSVELQAVRMIKYCLEHKGYWTISTNLVVGLRWHIKI